MTSSADNRKPRPSDAEDFNATVPVKGWNDAATIPASRPNAGSAVNLDQTVVADLNRQQPEADTVATQTASSRGNEETLLADSVPGSSTGGSSTDPAVLARTRLTNDVSDSSAPMNSTSLSDSGALSRSLSRSFSRTGRTRVNVNLPADTQQLDQKLQMSRLSVLSDMATARVGKGDLPPGIVKLIEQQGTEGRYAIDRPLASGGMGAVLQINDHDFRRPAAMKIILSRHANSAEVTERFLAEAQVTAQLEHPNIVPIHDLGVMEDGTLYFTMKLIEGMSLGRVMKLLQQQAGTLKDKEGNVIAPPDAESAAAAAKWTLEEKLQTFLKVLDGVGFAHSRGVVHRDIKPDNIMLGPFGEVLVVDWGIAKIIQATDQQKSANQPNDVVRWVASLRDHESASATMDGSAMGTLYYMPPEQALGFVAEVDARSDIYALGATLYELLALRRYLDSGNMADMISKISIGAWNRLDAVVPDLSLDLIAVVHRALSKERVDRYQSCAEFSADIRRYLSGQAVLARRRNLIERIGLWYAAHRRQVQVAAAGVALVVTAVTATVMVQQQEKRAQAKTLLAQAKQDYDAGRATMDTVTLDAARVALATALTYDSQNREISDLIALVKFSLAEAKRLEQERNQHEAASQKAQALLTEARQQRANAQLDEAAKTLDAAHKLVPSDEAINQLITKVATERSNELRVVATKKAKKDRAEGDAILAKAEALDRADVQVDVLLRQAENLFAEAEVVVPVDGTQAQVKRVALLRQAAENARKNKEDQEKGEAAATVARTAFAAKQFAQAKDAIAQALGFIPNRADLVALRDRIVSDEKQSLAEAAAQARLADFRSKASAAMADVKTHFAKLQEAHRSRAAAAAEVESLTERLADQPSTKKTALWQAHRVAQNAESVASEQWSLTEAAGQSVLSFLAEDPDNPLIAQAKGILAELYQARLTDARRRRDVANVVAFANLLTRYDDGRYANLLKDFGRLTLTGPAGTKLRISEIDAGADTRFVPVGKATELTLPTEPLALKGGRYELRSGEMVITLVVDATAPVTLTWPSSLPTITGMVLRYVPALAGRPAFLLGEREITAREYDRFLHDATVWPRVVASWKAFFTSDQDDLALMRLVPREAGHSKWQAEATDDDGIAGVMLTRLEMPRSIADLPIFGISRDDAEAYCAWLAKQTSLKIRLPSELEWQSAATGGDVRRVYPWGEIFDRSFTAGLMTPDGKKREAAIAVGTTPMDIGPFGHLDLGGNVSEWVSDRTNASTTHGAEVVGGSWAGDRPQDFRTTSVISAQPFFTNPSIGFRILVELP